MPALFLINSKKTSKGSIHRYFDMRLPWHEPFSKSKHGVVNPHLKHMIVDHLMFLSSI